MTRAAAAAAAVATPAAVTAAVAEFGMEHRIEQLHPYLS